MLATVSRERLFVAFCNEVMYINFIMQYYPSIRQKITLGYYAIVAMIISLSLFTFLELRYLEQKIIFGEAISEFFDTTLEIRRFEKNFFLYEKQSDYDENITYVSRAQEIID